MICKFHTTVVNWLKEMPLERWMTRARPLSRELEREEGSALRHFPHGRSGRTRAPLHVRVCQRHAEGR